MDNNKEVSLGEIREDAFNNIKSVFSSNSYVCDEKEFYQAINDTHNPHTIKYFIRSLEKWPPIYTWDILFEIAESFFNERYDEKFESAREALGPVILEVFFNKFPEPGKLYPPIPLDKLKHKYGPLDLFAELTEKQKRGYEQKIRKWLRELCQLLPLSEESPRFRELLACALAINGCFEECVDHQLVEAIPYVEVRAFSKFGEIYGMKTMDTPYKSKQPIEALRENHNAHALITLLRLMAIKGDLVFAFTVDTAEVDTIQLKPALIFRNPPPGMSAEIRNDIRCGVLKT